MGNNLFPEKDYAGLGDGPIDFNPPEQGYGAAWSSAITTGSYSAPVIGTGRFMKEVPPLALDKWVPPSFGINDYQRPRFTVSTPEAVEVKGDHLFQTEDELKTYEGYNSKIPFESGMTKSRYDALVELRTQQLRREAALNGHPFINVFGQMVGGAPDPSNYIPIFGSLGNAWKLGKGARLGWNTVRSGSEGAVGSTLATAALTSKEKAIGNDISLKTYIETASLGFLIGSVFGTLGHGIVRALNTGTVKQAAASQTIVSSPITPESAPEAVAVLADAYDSFMTNNGLATPFFAGGKGGPIEFGSNSQEAFTKGMQTAQKSIDLNWLSVIYRRKNEMEPLPNILSKEEKYMYLDSVLRNQDVADKARKEMGLPVTFIGKDGLEKRYSETEASQLKKELDDYYTIEVDQNVVSRIIDDPKIKARFKGSNGSKIKDATGRPITVFIGTPYGTNTRIDFDKSMLGKNTGGVSSRMALWATDNPDDASSYAIAGFTEDMFYGANNKMNIVGKIGKAAIDLFRSQDAPNVRPILLDMKNPMIVDYTGRGYDEFRHADSIKEAKKKGHDGVIFTNIHDTSHVTVYDDVLKDIANKAQKSATHYAIFDPKQIIDLQDVSTDFGKVIDAQQAYLNARKGGISITQEGALPIGEIKKGYSYDSQAASATTVNDVTANKFIDVLPLIKASEKNDEVKYQELSNEAASLDLEAKTTGFEDEMELALEMVPIRPEEKAYALKVDQDIAVADKLEVFINAAIKCMGS